MTGPVVTMRSRWLHGVSGAAPTRKRGPILRPPSREPTFNLEDTMHRSLASALFTLSLLPSAPLLAQDAPPKMSPEEAAMMAAYQKAGTPGDAHAALAKMAGSYDLSIRSWNDPVTKGKVNARMTTKWMSPDVEVFEMYAPGPDGKESKMMEITYTRK